MNPYSPATNLGFLGAALACLASSALYAAASQRAEDALLRWVYKAGR